jgi:hypothetical protein
VRKVRLIDEFADRPNRVPNPFIGKSAMFRGGFKEMNRI